MNIYQKAVEKFKKKGAQMGGDETVIVNINDEGFSHSPYQVTQLIDEGKHVVVHVQHEYSGTEISGTANYASDAYAITYNGSFPIITFSAIVSDGGATTMHTVYGFILENEEYWLWYFTDNALI